MAVTPRRSPDRCPACWWPTSPASSPGPYATMLLADLGADVIKVEGPARRRHPDLDAAGARRRRPPTTWASTAASGRSRWTCATTPTPRSARELARRADVVHRELQARRAGEVRPRLRLRRGATTRASSTPRSAGSAPGAGADVPGYDLMVQAISGLMSLTGDPDGPPYRAGISVFDVMAGNHAVIGILAALRHRDATGAGPARRGQPAVLGADRPGQPQLGVRRRRRRAVPDGQRAPERVPVRAAADRRRRPHRRRPATTGSSASCATCSGIPEVADDPRFARNADRTAQPRGAAPDPRRAAGAKRGAVEWFDLLVAAGRAVRADQHHRRRLRDGRALRAGPGRRGRRGRPGGPDDPAPDPVLRARRRPTGCHRPSSTSTAPSCGPGWQRPEEDDRD